ncbi:DUF1694 domain-containing protein [Bacillus sp. HMF5848]|uniref:YueI family protein n=1 Tax=Bacillus sp. HMF5848 TaxID=2495421 RepID=UPI000F7AE6EF|nr:YueI family protein [Bacillus sp. HMF5848]RSK26847.1 DUF1694 domain-containing protein [Bacillus sp. HMF5848]
MKENVEEYLDRGLQGTPELRRAERQEYLTVFRERIILALSDKQVRNARIYEPIVKEMKHYSKAHLYVDGELNYTYLSKYVKLAQGMGVPITIVNDVSTHTDIGLVLAVDYAIDKSEILIDDEKFQRGLK